MLKMKCGKTDGFAEKNPGAEGIRIRSDPDGVKILHCLSVRRLFAPERLPASALGFDVHPQSFVWFDFEHPDRRLFGNGSPVEEGLTVRTGRIAGPSDPGFKMIDRFIWLYIVELFKFPFLIWVSLTRDNILNHNTETGSICHGSADIFQILIIDCSVLVHLLSPF